MKPEELLRRIEQGRHAKVKFADFESLVVAFGFSLRRFGGSHRIYVRDGLPTFSTFSRGQGTRSRIRSGIF